MKFNLKRWVQDYDFHKLSHLNGTLTNLARAYHLKEGEALVVTSRGWHRLRLIVVLGQRACMIIPETHSTVLDTLAEWVKLSLRDGVIMLNEYRSLTQESKSKAA